MGKKKETISLIDTFSEFNELKNIDKATMISVLEESFRSVIAKSVGTDENFDIIINPDKGDLEIWRNRVIVEDNELQNPNMEISLTEALVCIVAGFSSIIWFEMYKVFRSVKG